jgi:hypothetical protein
MEHRWNGNDKKTAKYFKKNMSQRHLVQHKCHMCRSGIKSGPSEVRRLVTSRLNHGAVKGHCFKIAGQIAGKDLDIFTFRDHVKKKTWKGENTKRILR